MIGYFLSLAFLASTSSAAAPIPNDADGIFREAIKHWGSSSSHAAIVTIVDADVGAERDTCVQVSDLGRAVAVEKQMKWWPGHMDHVTERLLRQIDRRFVFQKAEALQILGKDRNYLQLDKELCSLIRKDIYAFRGDRPPTLYVGALPPN